MVCSREEILEEMLEEISEEPGLKVLQLLLLLLTDRLEPEDGPAAPPRLRLTLMLRREPGLSSHLLRAVRLKAGARGKLKDSQTD